MMETKKNFSEIRVLFSGASVFIEKEEFAYPFISLLADFGGVLGMFVGFWFEGERLMNGFYASNTLC